MKPLSATCMAVALLALSACSRAPAPEVAAAYDKKYGAVKTSYFSPCPKVDGVWRLSNLSDGSLKKDNGEIIEHFRWYLPKLFGLVVGKSDYIAVEESQLETTLYLSGVIPGPNGKRAVSFTAKTEKEMPCLGQGWRKAGETNHSQNDAAARVLKLVPESTVKIIQTDFFAKTAADELLLAIRIDYEGTNSDKKRVKDGYWHFLKLPRVHESPKAQGFQH